MASYQEALRLRPDYAMAHNNLGNALARLRRLDEAIASHGEALRLYPDYALAHNSLGNALHALGRIGEAVASFREALRLKPDYADAMNNLGNALSRSGQYAEAVACYRQALQIQPDFAMAHSNLVFVMHYDPAQEAETIFEEHRRWAAQHATPLARWIRPHYNKANPERPVRIGYVSRISVCIRWPSSSSRSWPPTTAACSRPSVTPMFHTRTRSPSGSEGSPTAGATFAG